MKTNILNTLNMKLNMKYNNMPTLKNNILAASLHTSLQSVMIAILIFFGLFGANENVWGLDPYVTITDFNNKSTFDSFSSDDISGSTYSKVANHVTFNINDVSLLTGMLSYGTQAANKTVESQFSWSAATNYSVSVSAVSIELKGYQAKLSWNLKSATGQFKDGTHTGTSVDCKTNAISGGTSTVSISASPVYSPLTLKKVTGANDAIYSMTSVTFTYKVTHKEYLFGFSASTGVNDSNYGSATVSVTDSQIQAGIGETSASTTATFTATPATGCQFLGWSTSEDGSTGYVSTETTYQPPINNSTAGSVENLTLYAIFSGKDTQTITWSQTINNQIRGNETTLSATASSGLGVYYTASSTNGATVSISGSKITCLTAGTITITAHQDGNDQYFASSNNPTRTFTIEEHAITKYPTASGTLTYEQTLNTISPIGGETNVPGTWAWKYPNSVPGAGTANQIAVFTPSNSIISGYPLECNVSVTVAKATPDVACTVNANTHYVEDTKIDLQTAWTREGNGTITYLVLSFVESGTNNGGGTTPYVENNRYLHLQKAGTAKVVMSINEGTNYIARNETIDVVINKKPNSLKVPFTDVNGWSKEIGYGTSTDVRLESDNTITPITVTPLSATGFATYDNANHKLDALCNPGTETWTVSQDENYKYLGATSQTMSVTMKAFREGCYMYNYSPDKKLSDLFNDGSAFVIDLGGVGDTLYFKIKMNGLGSETKVSQYYGSSNPTWSSTTTYKNSSYSYVEQGPIALLSNTTKIKFEKKSSDDPYITEIKVVRKTWLNAANLPITTQADGTTLIYPNTEGKGTLNVNYSLSNGGDLKLYCDNSKFTFTNARQDASTPIVIASNVDCKSGQLNIPVYYNTSVTGGETAHVVIFNSAFRKEVTITGTMVKRQQTITWKENFDKMSLETEEEHAATTNVEGVTVYYRSEDENIIKISEDSTKLIAVGVGTTTITAHTEATDEYEAGFSQQDIEVTEDIVQYIVWNQSLMGLSLNQTKPLNAYATSDIQCTTNGQRQITYESGNEDIVTISGNTLTAVGVGTTTVKATQYVTGYDVDGHKYAEVSKIKTVVVRDPNAPCEAEPIYTQQEEVDLFAMDLQKPQLNYDIDFELLEIEGKPDKLSFYCQGEAYKACGICNEHYTGVLKVAQKIDGNWIDVVGGNVGTPSTTNWDYHRDIQLDTAATAVRIYRPADGEGHHKIRDAQISLARYITGTPPAKYNAKVGESQQKTMRLEYSNIVGPMTITMGSGASSSFSVDQGMAEPIDGSCGDKGSVVLTITYNPQVAKDNELETMCVTDGTTTSYIQLSGSATVTERTIVWTQGDELGVNTAFTVQTPELTATAEDAFHHPAGTVYYGVNEGNTAGASVSGNVLSFTSQGQVYVTAYPTTDARYNDPSSVTKRWDVSLTPTAIDEMPTIGTIYGGTTANDVVLTGGGAKNTVNNEAVGGSFKVTSPATLNAGIYDVTIEFTPDNENMYSRCTATLENVTVSKITPEESELGVTVGEITCGQRIDEASLTRTGSLEGTWYWVDEEANHVTPVADTYDDLNVYFVPNNSNYATVYSTVSVKVNKLETLNVPVNLEFCQGASETYRGVEYTEAGTCPVNAIGAMRDTVYNVTVTVLQPTTGTDTKTITLGDDEYWNGIALKDSTVGVHEVVFHTDNAAGCDSTVTLTLMVTAPIINEFTNADGDGDWNNPNNWTSVPTDDEPNVIVKGALSIDESITVGNLTIESTGSVAVITGGALTVKGTSEYREAGYGDIHVLNDGAIHLDNSADLQVRHFTLDAKLAGKNNLDVKEAAASGQVENPSQLSINGDAYFQMTFDPKGKISFGWYDFVVPFPVNISDGIFREGDLTNHLVSGVDFIVQEYSESKCANNQKAWSNFSGTMQPGRVYTITFNYNPNFDQNVFVFKKASGAAIGGPTEFATQYTAGSGTTDDFGWNGLGNGTLQHGYINGSFAKMQVYNHAENKYDLLTGKNPTFAIGTSFFVQVDNTQPTMEWITAAANEDHPLYAPRRTAESVEEFLLNLREEDQFDACDHLYISESEEATEAYVIGHDLRKMGNPTEAKTAQMWATKNGKKLCDIETRIVNYGVSSDLNFFAPQAGSYELTVEEMPEDAALYLTYNEAIIWDLTASPYMLDLTKGTTIGYGLRIAARRSPQVTTAIETVNAEDSARKVLIDNKIYIVTPEGKMYDVVGKSMK